MIRIDYKSASDQISPHVIFDIGDPMFNVETEADSYANSVNSSIFGHS